MFRMYLALMNLIMSAPALPSAVAGRGLVTPGTSTARSLKPRRPAPSPETEIE